MFPWFRRKPTPTQPQAQPSTASSVLTRESAVLYSVSDPPVLKIKALALAEEAFIARRAEAAYREGASFADGLEAFYRTPEARLKALVDHKDLTAAQAERLLAKLVRTRQKYRDAHRHRTHTVRKEARAVHLARAFFRGTPYCVVESYPDGMPPFDEAQALVEQNSPWDVRIARQRWMGWRFDALAYWDEAQEKRNLKKPIA